MHWITASSVALLCACSNPAPQLPSTLNDVSSGDPTSTSNDSDKNAGSLEAKSKDKSNASGNNTEFDGSNNPAKSDGDVGNDSESTDSDKKNSEPDSKPNSGDSNDEANSNEGTTGNLDPSPLECKSSLPMIVRDFSALHHPDFSDRIGLKIRTGLVEPQLSPEGLPVYNSNTSSSQISNAQNFSQWFQDIKDINTRHDFNLNLDKSAGGSLNFLDYTFFPLKSDEGWGDEGMRLNFGFTVEIRTYFQYRAGQKFTIEADDDTWVFINRKLAVDMGGVHFPSVAKVNLDALGEILGLQEGSVYPIDIFHAERSAPESILWMVFDLCFVDSPPPPQAHP